MRKSDLIAEDNNGNTKQEPLDYDEKARPERSKWFKAKFHEQSRDLLNWL